MPKTRNKFEQKIQKQLRKAHATFSYETVRVPYILARNYIPDFILSTPMGRVFLECKGYFRAEAKAKMAAVKKQHPEMDLRIIFYAKNEKNIKWGEKLGIPWAIGKIPKEWIT
jgi:predicted nuclease of restriction endonuclease-like RecB superfamily